MPWIKQFSKGSFGLFAGNVIEAFQPIDFYHFFPLWYNLWISRIITVMQILDIERKPFSEIKDLLPRPSNMRAILVKMIPSYNGVLDKKPEEYKRVANFFARMLQEACPRDPFGERSNPYHSDHDLQEETRGLMWRDGNPQSARYLGQLITAAGSLAHGLYNDVVVDFAWEAYGPYRVMHKGEEYTLLMRHFAHLSPHELWPQRFLPSVSEVKIYALYQGVEWEIATVGCHTVVKKGNPITGLKKYVVVVDGEVADETRILQLINEFSFKAEALYRFIRTFDFEAIKRKVKLQECYQLKALFDEAGVLWEPTEEMYARVKDKPLMQGVVPQGRMVTTVAEFEEHFGINTFAREVLGEDL